MTQNYPTRIRILSICIFLFALLIIGRLYWLQVVQSALYLDKADRQYSSSAKTIFSRGSIFFQNKDGSLVSAATLKSGFTIAVNPKILKNPEDVYKKINEIIPLDHDAFIIKATKQNDPFEEIVNKVDLDSGQKIIDLKIVGLQAIKERWRFYPGGDTASHLVGLLGYQGDTLAGRYGLERQFNKQLERKDGAFVNFFAEIFSNIKLSQATTSENEADIITTIEPTVESQIQTILKATREKWRADSIGGIIMNPFNGEIYAMESNPTFDPNDVSSENDVSVFSNPLVENVYEMGSIVKPLTVAAGIDAGVITATSTYYDAGFVTVNNKQLKNFDDKVRKVVGIQDLLSQSLNVGAVHVQSLLGNLLFTKYIYAFGLNQKTGIDLPNEGKNLVQNLESPRDIEHATASFGQGIALTPISTIRALSAVANGGTLPSPHVVKKINYTMGISKDTPILVNPRVIKPQTSEDLSRMLVHSVDKVLLNGTLRIPNYSVAAKTGTAQIAKASGGGYTDDQVLHSFVGYFPAYNPRFIILLYMINPKGARFGSETLTVPFMNTVKFLINYYEVPPDR